MPRGASPKREKEYEKLVNKFKKNDRYKGREKEVASRIVNKQRAEYGETKKAKTSKSSSNSKQAPIRGYEKLTIPQVESRAKRMSNKEVGKVLSYEKKHKNRKTLLNKLERLKKSA